MFAWVAGKLAVPLLAAAALALGVWAIGEAVEIHGLPIIGGGLNSELAQLRDKIENPKTGYIARLAVANANAAALRNGLGLCNASVARLGAETRAATVAAQAAADAAKAGADRLVRSAAQILAARPGKDVCASADRLILDSTGGQQ